MLKTLLLTTCFVGAIASQGLAADVAEGDTLAENQTIRYWTVDSPKSLDPQKSPDILGSHVLRQLFEGLMNMDGEGNMIPGVATGYEVSDDGLTYTFTLRDANWSDGTPLTAQDFVYGWRRAVDPATASTTSGFMERLNVLNAKEAIAGETPADQLGVKAIDDKTFEVTLSTPTPYFIKTLSQPLTYPVKQSVVEEFGDDWLKPENMVSNGAYTLKDNTTGVSVNIVKNDNYWDAEKTVIDEIDFITINDVNIALTRYLAGELDWLDAVPTGQYPTLAAEHPDEAHSLPSACSYAYIFNLAESGPEALKDVRVRRALSLGIDRDTIVEKILQGGQKPAYNWTQWATAGFEVPDLEIAKMTQAERNEKAKELLAEAGYGPDNPLKVTLQYNTSEGHKKIAIAVQQFWKGIGINAELVNYEWKVFLDRMSQGEFEVARAGWCAEYNDPSGFLNYFSSTGRDFGKFANAEYEAVLEAAKTSANPAEQYKEAEVILDKEVPYAPVYHYSNDMLVDADLRGLPLKNLEFRWYGKDMYRVAE